MRYSRSEGILPAQLRKPGEIAAGGAKRQVGYTKGVPMGDDLRDAPAGEAPTFLVSVPSIDLHKGVKA